MKTRLFAAFAAILIVGGIFSQAAHSATPVAQHGPFTVSALDDGQTCMLSAANETAGFALGVSANDAVITIGAANSAAPFIDGQRYTIKLVVDGQTFDWNATGLSYGSTPGVIALSPDVEGVYSTLTTGENLTIYTAEGAGVVSVNLDANFDSAFNDTVYCALLVSGKAK